MHPAKGITDFWIQVKATGNLQKQNNVLRIPIQPGRALYHMQGLLITAKCSYGCFQSILFL